MSGNRRNVFLIAGTLAGLALASSGCTTFDRLAQAGESPPLTRIQNPKAAPNYRPISMPMPSPKAVTREPNSLWRTGSRAFFKDQRATDVGDIITVVIDLSEKAILANKTIRTRVNAEDATAGALLGYEAGLANLLPEEVDNTDLFDIDSSSRSEGNGTIDRKEEIKLTVAAIITQVLPNGNLVLHGRQEIRVNFEVRELQVAGVIRPADITSTNTISFDKIAEARIAYGGRGHIADIQQPRLGQQMFDIIFPF